MRFIGNREGKGQESRVKGETTALARDKGKQALMKEQKENHLQAWHSGSSSLSVNHILHADTLGRLLTVGT